MSRLIFSLLLTWFSVTAHAASWPKSLSTGDRVTMLEILGFGSQNKILSSPVPLGGYQGFEVGVSSEYIPIKGLSELGDQPDIDGEFNLVTLSVGKGLAENVDTFFTFTPLPQSEKVVAYGAQLRWGFYEFERWPALLSFIAHGGGANFANLLGVRTTGADLVMTLKSRELALYFGSGLIRTIGTYQGGAAGLTGDNTSTDVDLMKVHSVVGLNFQFERFHFTVEVDRVVQAAYAGRIGYRF